MASRRVRVRTRGVSIDTQDVIRSLRNIEDQTRQKLADLAEEALKAIIDALNDQSSMRVSELLSEQEVITAGVDRIGGTRDKPFKNARVVIVGDRRNTRGTRGKRIVVYVDHKGNDGINLFNVLDVGIKPRIQHGNPVFPVYDGHTTQPYTSGTQVEGQGGSFRYAETIRKRVSLKRDEDGKIVVMGIPEGYRLREVEGRNFYEAVARYVQIRMLKSGIISVPMNGRIAADRIGKNQVEIRVGVFNK